VIGGHDEDRVLEHVHLFQLVKELSEEQIGKAGLEKMSLKTLIDKPIVLEPRPTVDPRNTSNLEIARSVRQVDPGTVGNHGVDEEERGRIGSRIHPLDELLKSNSPICKQVTPDCLLDRLSIFGLITEIAPVLIYRRETRCEVFGKDHVESHNTDIRAHR
jgi:hypothetical protein